jgi:hypothetical protein
MVARNPLVLINGQPAELPAGDTVNGGGIGYHWAKIANDTLVAITSATSATLNRLHVVSGTSADYDITISGLSPSAGDVLGFYVKNWSAANKQFRLDAGGTVKIAGRTRYLVLMHTNVALLRWDGTDWQPLVLSLDTAWVDGGATTITAATTNPTKGTITDDKLTWRRVGDSVHVDLLYNASVGGTAGAGDYYWKLPQNFAGDAARMPSTNGHVVGNGQINGNIGGSLRAGIGSVSFVSSSSTTVVRCAALNDASSYNNVSSTHLSMGIAGEMHRLNYTLPIVDW